MPEVRYPVQYKHIVEPAMPFVWKVLQIFDTSKLEKIEVKPSRSARMCPGAYGNWRKTKKTEKFRISVILAKPDYEFPDTRPKARRMGRAYGYHTRPEAIYSDITTIVVWTMMHEIFHHIAYHGQSKANYADEKAACKFADAMTTFYTKGW